MLLQNIFVMRDVMLDYLRRSNKTCAAYRQLSLLLRRPPGREAFQVMSFMRMLFT